MLKIRFKDNKYNAVWLVEPKITIGRSATNALVVDDDSVGDVHIEVLVDHENLTLKNLIPSRPVSVNNLEVTGACALKAEDIVTIGSVELIVVDPKREAKVIAQEAGNATQLRTPKPSGWSLKSNHTALANRVFPLKEVTVVGRSNDCDICLSAAHLSRRHAQLQVIDGMLFVRDLGSANGTFLNGKQVAEARVKRGDELRFDSLSFGVIGPPDEMAKTTVRKVDVKTQAAEARAAARVNSMATPGGVAPTRSSSMDQQGFNFKPKTNEEGNKGKFGLIFLGALAVVVIAALVLTRK